MQTWLALLLGVAIATMAAVYGAHRDCASGELRTPFADYNCTPKINAE